MATYTVAASEVGAHKKLTTANTVDTINFGRKCLNIEVISDGSADLYFTVDGSVPTVDGNGGHRLPSGIPTAYDQAVYPLIATTVKVISSGAVTYSVTGDSVSA